jgi:hypothetical protein
LDSAAGRQGLAGYCSCPLRPPPVVSLRFALRQCHSASPSASIVPPSVSRNTPMRSSGRLHAHSRGGGAGAAVQPAPVRRPQLACALPALLRVHHPGRRPLLGQPGRAGDLGGGGAGGQVHKVVSAHVCGSANEHCEPPRSVGVLSAVHSRSVRQAHRTLSALACGQRPGIDFVQNAARSVGAAAARGACACGPI